MKIDLRNQSLDARWCQYTAYLNGVELKYCLMADEEAGEAVCGAHDGNGHVFFDDQGNCIEIVHHGHVELLRTRRHPDARR